MKYSIEFTQSALKEAKRLPRPIWERIKSKISSLSENPNPSSSKKLEGYSGIYRIRIGSYRVVYELKHVVKIILIIKIGHRKDIYRNS